MKHHGRRRSRLRLPYETCEPRTHLAAHLSGSSTNFATIQAAVDAAVAGQTITVDAGTYSEQVFVDKSLTIRGAKAGVDARTRATTSETILTGIAANGAQTSSFYISADNVTLDGFTVQGETSQSTTRGAGIVIAPKVSGTHLYNNIIQKNVAGVFLSNYSTTNPALIKYNLFQTNNNAGINGGRGIYTNGEISGGNLTNVTIEANSFISNSGGSGTTGLEPAVGFEAATAGKQSDIRIVDNSFTNNGKSVLFFNTTGVLLHGNTATGARDWFSGSLRFEGNNHDVTIEYNTIYANTGPGVAVDSNGVAGDSSGFVVTHNNIYGNGTTSGGKLGVVFNQKVYDGAFDVTNNYWGNSTGPSGDGPGTGDSVYGNASKANQWSYAKGGIETFSPWSASFININVDPVPAAPVGFTASTASTSQINLSWTLNSNLGITYTVERSIDGTNFTPIATGLVGTATSYADTGLAAGTTYFYRLSAVNSFGSSPTSSVVNATTIAANAIATQLSALNWTSATSGWNSPLKNQSVAGNPLKLRGTTYTSGIGTHASSTIVFNLAGNSTRFISDVGVDDEVNGKGTGSVDFQVIGDGKVLFDSGVVTNASGVVSINVDVTGVKTLTLVANSVNGDIDFAHADWANARLLSNPVVPAAPTNVAASILSTSAVKVSWAAAIANAPITGYRVERSLDGISFSTIATLSASTLSYSDSGLNAGTRYVYRVYATNSAGESTASTAVSATTLPATVATTPLSSLTWVSATAGYGSVQKNLNASGDPLNINGTPYASGIGTHASSTIVYNLAGAYTTFQSDIGYDYRTSGKPSDPVYFQVIGDGKVLFDSGAMTNASPTLSISVDVSGVQSLTLIANAVVAGNIDYGHVDWGNARLLSPGASAAAFKTLSVSKPDATTTSTTSTSTTAAKTTTAKAKATVTPAVDSAAAKAHKAKLAKAAKLKAAKAEKAAEAKKAAAIKAAAAKKLAEAKKKAAKAKK